MMGELLTGHHSGLAYEIAKEIVEMLIEGDFIHRKDEYQIRGRIQIKLEGKRGEERGEAAEAREAANMAEIKTLKELRQELFGLWDMENKRSKGTPSDYKAALGEVFELINSFEAGLRETTLTSEELKFLDGVWAFLYSSKMSYEDYNRFEKIIEKIKRLCKILGEEGSR